MSMIHPGQTRAVSTLHLLGAALRGSDEVDIEAYEQLAARDEALPFLTYLLTHLLEVLILIYYFYSE